MKGTRFIEVLSALKPEDMNLLEEFVNSPIFNKNKRVIPALNFLKSAGNNVTKENLAKAAFGTEKYTDANFRMFVSYFTDLIEKFLLYKNIDEAYLKTEFIYYTHISQLNKSFEKHSTELYKNLISKPAKTTNDYFILYRIESMKRISTSKIEEYADLMYLSMKLDIGIAQLSEGKTYEDITGLIDKGFLKMGINKYEHIFIYAKLLAYSLLSAEKNTSEELEKLAQKYCNDTKYYKFVIDVLLWHCRKIGDHNKEFQLIKELDCKKILTKLDRNFFLMMIDSGLAINDLAGVVDLYNKYRDLVSSNDALLGKVYIEVFKRNYDNALKALSEISITDSFYYEHSAKIKLLIYRETNEKELYRYTYDAYNHWKNRKLKKKAE